MGCGASTANPRRNGTGHEASSLARRPLEMQPARLRKLTEIFKSMDTDGDGQVDLAEFRSATSNPTMVKLFHYMDEMGNSNGSLTLNEWISTMYTVGKSLTEEAFDRDLASMHKPQNELVVGLEPARLAKLKSTFMAMDMDGDGTVDLAEYKASTSNPTMLKLFDLMDSGGNGNGELTLDEWLAVMSKVGKSMSDEQFEADLLSMIKPAELQATMGRQRVKKLKELFHRMDEDGGKILRLSSTPFPFPLTLYDELVLADGTVDFSEYKSKTNNETMLKLFSHMDAQGDNDGTLNLDEWLTTMGKVGQSKTDEEFEKDLLGLFTTSSAH